ncbi:arabinosyltransferase domain-containing protein [Amycolatopsis anabasis]|uniref:arabinosyltransferase domain-containing protein n=1 Tax=Amycolatopsis anabasis TaxID=1840409 RepID=UPI00131DFB81|nr:arabinosyltransferase domain-containing protein [Amycolatopsis anabasis]
MWTPTQQRSATREEVTEPEHPAPGTRKGLWKLLAVVLGLAATACALAFPFLPVVQDTAKIVWPAGSDTRPVNAPLTGYWAQDMRVDLPCATVQSLDARSSGPGLLFSTIPPQRSENGAGIQVRVDNGLLTVFSRGQQVVRQPLPPTGCDVQLTSDAKRTAVTVGGTVLYDAGGDVRPRVVGIYTDITGAKDPIDGLGVTITPDTRYQSSPTGLKVGIGIFAVLAAIGCLIAVNRLDRGVARRAPRWAPVGWWRLSLRDLTVFGALGAWVFIGPLTSDDGYVLSMARVTEQVGYLTNYHRWFGAAEAPIGWFYHVYELMTHVSTVPPWIRPPSFLPGVISWLRISREVMPRLGSQVRASKPAGWAAAAVFLVWWMPFNNGVRPEPVGAVGSLLALCAVERALVTRRLLPVCLGLLAAAFTVAATPTGLIAVAPFLVAARPLFHLLRARAREGWLPVLAPIAGAGFLVLVVIFADQTFATVVESSRLRGQVGPNLPWFQEPSRYQLLFANSADGSIARRFPVLLLILCTVTCLVVLLRRGRIPGAALGPSRRLIGTVALFFLLMVLTPTKWTHHFGAFAAVGAAMAALAALATSSTVLRSKRNRAAFVAGLLVVAALAATGPNTYSFVSNLGVPWFDKAPSIKGISLASVFLVAAAVAGIYAFIGNVRAKRPGPPGPEEGRALKFGALSLVVVCGLFAVFEFGTVAKAIQKQRTSYSLGAANIEHLFGKNCNLSDHVMVETDPVDSVLQPAPGTAGATVLREPKPVNSPLPDPEEGTGKTETGFHSRSTKDNDPLEKPPHGFTPDTVPMWSSYQHDPSAPTGRLRTDWYGLPDERAGKQLVLAMDSPHGKATSVEVEFGAKTAEGIKIARKYTVLGNGAGSGSWGDVRLELGDLPPGVTLARVVAKDDDLTEDGWVAVTAPRVPSFTTLTERVGNAPVYIDWPASFVYPCMNPVTSHDGISALPAYRITSGSLAKESDWASSAGGGPNGWLEEIADEPEVPSFLKNNPAQPWGQLKKIEPYAEETAPPQVVRGQEVRPGWWSPGPGPQQPNGTTATR